MMKNLAAALQLFTRLPFWRMKSFNVPLKHYEQALNYWPMVGWLTAGVTAGMLFASAQILPYSLAIIISILTRVLLTGALHEDGLADFFDGFGGGKDREAILRIMKDSHIGTYGVLSLIFYFLLLFQILSHLPLEFACLAILVGDPLCKLICSQIIRLLPYARNSESNKSKVVYAKPSFLTVFISLVMGLLPLAVLMDFRFWIAAIAPIVLFVLLVIFMKKKIGGYTGDCCGASFLLCELSFYLSLLLLISK